MDEFKMIQVEIAEKDLIDIDHERYNNPLPAIPASH
jgi:hypothetical protein